MSCNWNEQTLTCVASINWRASLVPAAAVIPAPIVYIKVAAVKMLVVEFLLRMDSPPAGWVYCLFSAYMRIVLQHLTVPYVLFIQITLRKLECFEHAYVLNTLAWNNNIGSLLYSIGFIAAVMTNRDNWWHSDSIVRGEILGFIKNDLLRKHLPIMFSLIKN